MITINFIRKATDAAIISGTDAWDVRISAYWKAYSRRLHREARDAWWTWWTRASALGLGAMAARPPSRDTSVRRPRWGGHPVHPAR